MNDIGSMGQDANAHHREIELLNKHQFALILLWYCYLDLPFASMPECHKTLKSHPWKPLQLKLAKDAQIQRNVIVIKYHIKHNHCHRFKIIFIFYFRCFIERKSITNGRRECLWACACICLCLCVRLLNEWLWHSTLHSWTRFHFNQWFQVLIYRFSTCYPTIEWITYSSSKKKGEKWKKKRKKIRRPNWRWMGVAGWRANIVPLFT